MSKFKHSKAFSLLELIITVAVLAAGITVLLQAFSFSSRITGLSNDMIRAVFLAEDKLQELEFKEKQDLIKQEPSLNSGTSDKFQFKTTIAFDADVKLYKANFALTWQRGNRAEEIVVKTYLK